MEKKIRIFKWFTVALMVIAIVIIILNNISGTRDTLFLASIACVLLFSFFLLPMLDHICIAEKSSIRLKHKYLYALQSIIAILFICAFTNVMSYGFINYNTLIWISCIILFILFLSIDIIRLLYDRATTSKTDPRPKRLSLHLLLLFVLLISAVSNYQPTRIIDTTNLKLPDTIVVAKVNSKISGHQAIMERTDITDKEVINSFISQLSKSQLENIRNIDYLNYAFVSEKDKFNYWLIPVYNIGNVTKGLDNGYLGTITIHPDGFLTIQESRQSLNIFRSRSIYYKTNISPDTVNGLLKTLLQ